MLLHLAFDLIVDQVHLLWKKIKQNKGSQYFIALVLIQQKAKKKPQKTQTYTVYLVEDNPETNLNTEYYNRFADHFNCKFECTVAKHSKDGRISSINNFEFLI